MHCSRRVQHVCHTSYLLNPQSLPRSAATALAKVRWVLVSLEEVKPVSVTGLYPRTQQVHQTPQNTPQNGGDFEAYTDDRAAHAQVAHGSVTCPSGFGGAPPSVTGFGGVPSSVTCRVGFPPDFPQDVPFLNSGLRSIVDGRGPEDAML
eukprot:2572923-Prymnesium_polylepis.1